MGGHWCNQGAIGKFPGAFPDIAGGIEVIPIECVLILNLVNSGEAVIEYIVIVTVQPMPPL